VSTDGLDELVDEAEAEAAERKALTGKGLNRFRWSD
jgi:hypothetical protein